MFFLQSEILKLYKTNAPKKEAQNLFDFIIRQLELSIRELGYGDVSVNKKMKEYVNLFFSIIENIEIWDKLSHLEKTKMMSSFFNISYYTTHYSCGRCFTHT